MLFIQETKLSLMDDRLINYCCGNDTNLRSLSSPSVGASGGLSTIWCNSFFEKDSDSIHRYYIILQGLLKPLKARCNIINLYAPNDQGERLTILRELISFVHQSNLPTILAGDLNTVLCREEKVGTTFNKSAAKDLKEFIDCLEFQDLPLNGGRFTWANTRKRVSTSRLDRFLFSTDFSELWPNLIQKILPKSLSDHNPVGLFHSDFDWGPKPFRWFDYWAEDKGLVSNIIDCYKQSSGQGIAATLRLCKSASKAWVKAKKGRDYETVQSLERECAEMEDRLVQNGSDPTSRKNLVSLKEKLWGEI
ncbi:hypothetical protein HRI_004107800 [Hibiscus trionum]|uniref:Endonuclease/exonuclease/phosphatase domain-containing protein n=1 Tax=Hibiscus trionum TaxID=183268 RepID=A0A9W7IXD3_HIBTR|nr:hypothetical protein HRI_004107800 [Hibiscus trionum]